MDEGAAYGLRNEVFKVVVIKKLCGRRYMVVADDGGLPGVSCC